MTTHSVQSLDNRSLDNRSLDNRSLDNRSLDNRSLDNRSLDNTSNLSTGSYIKSKVLRTANLYRVSSHFSTILQFTKLNSFMFKICFLFVKQKGKINVSNLLNQENSISGLFVLLNALFGVPSPLPNTVGARGEIRISYSWRD